MAELSVSGMLGDEAHLAKIIHDRDVLLKEMVDNISALKTQNDNLKKENERLQSENKFLQDQVTKAVPA